MSAQVPFDFEAEVSRLERDFRAWLQTADGEAVYRSVRRRALGLRSCGWKRYGIAALWEAARFDRDLEVGPDAHGWKLNNNYRAYMARLLMEREPDLAGFFEIRTVQG